MIRGDLLIGDNDHKHTSAAEKRKQRMSVRKSMAAAAEAQALTRKRQMERGQELLNRGRKRSEYIIRGLLVIGGLGIFFLILVGMILLEVAESCRFPRHVLCETFTYTIDIKYPLETLPPAPVFRGGKIRGYVGGQLDNLRLSQDYGTYRLEANNDPETSDVIIEVCNRAQDKYWLTRTTTMTAEKVLVGEDPLDQKWMVNIDLDSQTSGEQSGENKCRRADVVVYVPTLCLLDDTKLFTTVTKGNLYADNLTTNFDTVTMFNDNGLIRVNELTAQRVNLNSSYGQIEATDVSSHFMFLQQRSAGGTIQGKDLHLFPSDNSTSCTTRYYYRDGFPELPEYLLSEQICDQEEGRLTANSKGEEGRIVTLDRVGGGSIAHQNKVGETQLDIVACIDFSGTFDLRADSVTIQMGLTPEQIEAAKKTLGGVNGARAEMKQYFTLDPEETTARRRVGTICTSNSGIEDMPKGSTLGNHTLDMWSIETGPLIVNVWPPAYVASSAWRLEPVRGILFLGMLLIPCLFSTA